MTFLWASIALFGLIALGIFLFKFLEKREIESKNIVSVEQLLARRKESKRYGLPLFLFSLFVSTVFVSWSFDAKYLKLVEKKMYDQKVEEVDSIIQYVIKINTPPPPPKPADPTPKVVEQKIEVPEIKIVEKVNKEKKEDPVIDPDFNPNVDFEFDEGPVNPIAQTTDNRIYFPGELSENAEFVGGFKALVDYITKTTYYAKKPLRAEKNNEKYTVLVTFVIEKDGSISGAKIMRGGEELDEDSKEIIIKALKSMPKWKPAKLVDETKRQSFNIPITLR